MPIEVEIKNLPYGISNKKAQKGEIVEIISREFTSSEDGDVFIQRLKGIPFQLLDKVTSVEISPSTIDNMLILIFQDKKARIYINELKYKFTIQAKKAIIQGQPITYDDIADIRELGFLDLEVPKNVGIIFLFSIDWRKGLYFDYTPLHKGFPSLTYKPEAMFGQLYALLSYKDIFSISPEEWQILFEQQWFPFISLSRNTIRKMIGSAHESSNIDEMINKIQSELVERFDIIKTAWEKNPYFTKHCQILEHAIQEYIEKDYISTTALLYPRIEGIMSSYHHSKSSSKSASQNDLVSSVIKIGGANINPLSFLMPNKFEEYLKKVYFAHFDPSDPKVVSRNTISHGVAPEKDFSLKSATIAFLIIDQLLYFLKN
jgi:hypothetical protein